MKAVVELRRENTGDWKRHGDVLTVPEYEFINSDIKDLSPAARYDYHILSARSSEKAFAPIANGSFMTQRSSPASYTAILITDPHVGSFAEDSEPIRTLAKVVEAAARDNADFALALGDNVAWPGSREIPQPDTHAAVNAYALYRRHLGPLTRIWPHFGIIGNWCGENGKFPEASIRMVSGVRQAFLPHPNDRTYPQGGSEWEDYYAFSWGDALYVMLNVQTYSKPSRPEELASAASDVSSIEDWTLGGPQMTWLEATLKAATERFRFICMHHPAGGNAGNPHETLYGRGGYRAWDSGEQRRTHELMKQHKVQIFFYGHDHVFVDEVVDGIHYALPGSCGAPWKFTRAETGYERFWSDSGHARLEITPERATVTFINLAGEALHSFSVLPA